ncbi:Catenin beta-1, variant 2 [Schistosoma haematobium]|uniref:Armadillo segment polarity protein n=1 Tax=Schistosoma haematobium TaxID=6185 RepID=A0A094ZPA0_SCHHA|nr:Catenin beta-1, variant 2 [Schistosoma haematobium]KAH9588017.1 Catenin beta-1, variant 2 [Schistosoma haematobium]CAH8557588.1 unnamed protein product [Schistosoma haematobium]CAH8561394.1 unnamed protein product [Schistosoma haematobium]
MDSVSTRLLQDAQTCNLGGSQGLTMNQVVDADSVPTQMVDKCHRVKMWQQTNYLSDSGIHSAVGTHTPSISSKVECDDAEADDRYLTQKPGHLPHWSSFPLSVNPSDSCLLSPATPSTSSILGVDSLSDVGGSHSASNVDLRGNKLPEIDTDEAAGAIPELVKLIKDEDDQVIIYQSSMMVFQLSKSEAIDALIKSRDMIDCIISALDRTEDPETVRFLAGTLYNISQMQPGLKAIFAAQCIPSLVKLLNSPVESVLFYAITTLHNLLLHQDGAKAVVRQSGCLQKMTALLRKNNIKFLTICTDCLQILAYGHQESKLQILCSGGPIELVRILRTYQYEKLLWTTARVLKVLSVCASNKPAIIVAGGMDALAKHLHSSSHRLVLNCLWALRNLSDAATKMDNLQPLLHSLVRLLDCGDSSMITCAAGILSNLTCNNHANKFIVFKMGGVEALLRAVSQPAVKEDILEPCMCALRHLTSRHEEEETARHALVHELNGLPIIARVLHAATAGICPDLGLVCQHPQNPVVSWMLVKAMVGLLRNLSVTLDSHYGMRECGLVTGLFLLLYAAQYEIIRRSVSSTHPTFSTVVQSVRLEEIVEGICGALHMLAKDHATRSYLALLKAPALSITPSIQSGSSGLAIFVELLHSPHESIQRASAGVLAEVSQDRDGLEALATLPGAGSRFDELVRSRNEAISTYASAVVIRLAEERRGIGSNPYIFSSHIESLNTPPLPMDTGEVYHVPTVHPGGTLHPEMPSLTHHGSWNHGPLQTHPQESGNTCGSPSNSLMEMLGPFPPGCKGSVCNDCCSYWGDCDPPGTCSDPNCIYNGNNNQSSGTYSELQPVKLYHNIRSPSRTGFVGCGNIYSVGPTLVSSSVQNIDNTHQLQGSNPVLPTGMSVVPRRSCVGSISSSGYLSPGGDMFLNPSPSEYKPFHEDNQGILRPSLLDQQTHAASISSPAIPSRNVSAGYLSPDLMALEETDPDWFGGPAVM